MGGPGGTLGAVSENTQNDAQLDAIRTGYAFEGATLNLGAAVSDGTAVADVQVGLPLATMNRHGLIAGATGTGKTKTLQMMAEQLSAAGVPVFLADMKGDLSGLATEGQPNEKLTERTQTIGQDWQPKAAPVDFLTLGGQGKGAPIRTTVTDFGPMLLAKVLGLNETQESALSLIFHYADQAGLALLDLKDLREVIMFLTSDEGKGELKNIGGVSPQTAGVILRELTTFANNGAEVFFGEPEFDTADLLRVGDDGRGVISNLQLPGVASRPELFSTFLMWLLADLFHDLPEVGDVDKPKLVFFFDEAHLLFKDASKEFLSSIEQTVRLIRSKGVGVFFITQTPKDVPAEVLGQLGNRVQHALRAFTPDDAKALKATARTYPSSEYDLEQLLTQLGTGEAVVTVLSESGAPTPVAWTRMRAPETLMDIAPDAVFDAVIAASPLTAKYSEPVDRESAYEVLKERLEKGAEQQGEQAPSEGSGSPEAAEKEPAAKKERAKKESGGFFDNPAVKSMMRSAGSALGREITRSLFGTARRRR
ncbi:DUF853 family protein [Kocuria sp. JC486]|uniref:DUF853 family protein n=1 Tax=Kocuria soli TaxID=2485125 RepID=A0A3N3ZTY2_9MICC|nr:MULTISPECIES: helicase HerA-like domain-containing protein [Kocuria]NHU85973.1 DUF853 family protein [Kocuria sp. JC486]ROZ65768.1 DUF853 family protein [Kocuria soli]